MSTASPPEPDDPIEYFVEHLESAGRDPETVRNYSLALRRLRTFLMDQGMEPSEATENECIALISSLSDELATGTVRNYTSSINRFYQFFSNRGTFETNPMAVALEEVDVAPENNSHRREVSLEQMQEFIADTDDPQAQTAMVLFAKTGIRKSELVNLDLRDLYIDHPGARRELPKPRSEITGNPDSLFIADNRVSKGDVVNGDRRTAGNKRKNTTVVPLDDELKQTLLYWIAARPPSKSEALPLFVMRTDGSSERKAGDRVTKGAIGAAVRRRATERGWYTKSGGVQGNVTPHYFRHWFTTMAEQNGMSRPIVKYLRGDVGNDIVDRNYRHFWNNEVRTEYINTIYKLFPS